MQYIVIKISHLFLKKNADYLFINDKFITFVPQKVKVMINIPKNLVKAVADGSEQPIALESYIMHNYSMGEIISSFAELLITSETYTRQPIAVSQEEFNAIASLFKVKGQRVLEDGTITEETRGRRPKNKA